MNLLIQPSPGHYRFPVPGRVRRGFALVVTIVMMSMIVVLVLALLALATSQTKTLNMTRARIVAASNARLALDLALSDLQKELGDDRRVTADGALLEGTQNPAAVGVWNGWTPDLVSKSNSSSTPRVDYDTPKGQAGFRKWMVSAANPTLLRRLDWHKSPPAQGNGNAARLFTQETSGFDLPGEKLVFTEGADNRGAVAWAVAQENTKARINIGTDEARRLAAEDARQAPSRPNVALSATLKQPETDWPQRAAKIESFPTAALDPAYGVTPQVMAREARDYTTTSMSLLTDAAKGGLKVDLNTGFELDDTQFFKEGWTDSFGSVVNPFRSRTVSEYKGQKPLYLPLVRDALCQVYMDFYPASLYHRFTINGVPTFDMLRSYYQEYRHLYGGDGGGVTAFERPYAHIATTEKVNGRPYGLKTQPAVGPILDRMNLLLSLMCKADGSFGVLVTPFITLWNPYNVDVECEGTVVYPWIDFAVFVNFNILNASGASVGSFNTSMSKIVGEGYAGTSGSYHGRSARPYFYFHLTQSGNAAAGAQSISPPIHLQPGEVRVFCLSDLTRRDLETLQGAPSRTWRMKAVTGPTDITQSLVGGVFLNCRKPTPDMSPIPLMSPGYRVNAGQMSFNRSSYNHIVCMADGWQIKNPGTELMADDRPADSRFPALPREPNLYFWQEVHSLPVSGSSVPSDVLSYPSYSFEELNETPRLVGSYMTYHRVAQTSSMTLADMMFTSNPRQPFVTNYLTGGTFETGPHYETLLRGGTSLAELAMETSFDGRNAFFGASHSASTGRTHLPFFEIPRSPMLSLGAFQHCDVTATAFGVANQIGNGWSSPYQPANTISKIMSSTSYGVPITPSGLAVYDASYLSNEAIFDKFFFSGAAPRTGSAGGSGGGSPALWDQDTVIEKQSLKDVLDRFYTDSRNNPLLNPRMTPYLGERSPEMVKQRLEGSARCARMAAHLMLEGGFDINSASEEAWLALLASLRGVSPASTEMTALSRFRHILPTMVENDAWSGFRTLSDNDLRALAKNLVEEVKRRGPFLSLGEFVNRHVADDSYRFNGTIQNAIDRTGVNKFYSYATFDTSRYPNPENLKDPNNPNTGTNTPGWLSQADVLHSLAPFLTVRSDTFTIRSLGEARGADGRVLTSVRLEAVVQRVPDWMDTQDEPEAELDKLKSEVNKKFGRRFKVISIREILLDPVGNPV